MFTGGGARSGLWPDILAAVYGQEVRVHISPGETTSLGAAIAAGVGVGLFESYEQAAQMVKTRSRHAVNPAWREKYAEMYPLYADDLRAHAPHHRPPRRPEELACPGHTAAAQADELRTFFARVRP